MGDMKVFTEDQFHVFRNQIRTLLNLGLRLKILSGQSKARIPDPQEVPQTAAPICDEQLPGAAVIPRAALPAGVAIAPGTPTPATAPIVPANTAVADGKADASLSAEPMGELMQQQPVKSEPSTATPTQQQRPRQRPPKLPGTRATGFVKKRKRVSPEASIDLEATSEGGSGTSEEGAAVSGHPGDSNSEVQERSTSLEDPPKGPLSRRSGRKTKQVSLDGVSGEVIDAMVEEPVVASGLHATAQGTSAAGTKRARNPRKGKGRTAFSMGSGQLVPLQPDSVGIPQEPTLLPQLTPVSAKVVDPEDPPCNVCGDREDGEGNEMLMCDGKDCRVVVHQACYGVASIPSGDWLCDGCKAGLDPNGSHCLLCPVPSGALRKVTSFGNWRPPGTKAGTSHRDLLGWVHTGCALWMPEVKLTQPDLLEGVDLSELPCERILLVCALCHQPGGSVMECSLGACSRLQHISCARQAACLTPFAANGATLVFCPLHSRPRFLAGRTKAAGAYESTEQPYEDDEAPAKPPTEYELERHANIQRNRQRLAELAGTSPDTGI